jgi:hypothetical protein
LTVDAGHGGEQSRVMPSPFDGAGEPYRGPRFRGPIIAAIVCIVVIALIWLAYIAAVDMLPPGTVPEPPRF